MVKKKKPKKKNKKLLYFLLALLLLTLPFIMYLLGNTAPDPRSFAAIVQPVGQTSGWTMVFYDEFDGTSVDRTKWVDSSSAEADGGHGNKGNQQLEWNQMANCTVTNGELTMTARRQSFSSPSGIHYDWTSCLLTTSPSFTFQYGYIEEKSILPSPKGFWPAFWTWQAPGVNTSIETDGYEFYSDNHKRLYFTSHTGARGGCTWTPPFDPTTGWHTYGVDISPSGTKWYVDGVQVCQAAGTATGRTNIITNLAVYSTIPPDVATNNAFKKVDYIRAWQRCTTNCVSPTTTSLTKPPTPPSSPTAKPFITSTPTSQPPSPSQSRVTVTSLKEQGSSSSYPATVSYTLTTTGTITTPYLVVAVRKNGVNYDFPGRPGVRLTGVQSFTAKRSFPKGTYVYWVAYNYNGRWINLSPKKYFTIN